MESGIRLTTKTGSGIKILIVFGIRDQHFGQKYGISYEKIYLVTTLSFAWSRLTSFSCSTRSSFIRFYIKHENTFQTQQKKETITDLRALSCHIWGKNLPMHTGSDFRPISCKNSPLLLQERSLGPRYQYFDFYGGSSFPRSEEADFYGGRRFLQRRLNSTEEADFYGGGSFLQRRL